MTTPHLETLEREGVTIVLLAQEYDNLDEPALEASANELLSLAQDVAPPRLVLDMTRTRFFGSAFLGCLFRVWRRLTKRGGTLTVCCATGVCREVLDVTHTGQLWKIYDSQDEAVEALKS